jgi:hypothetical protein
MWRCKQSEEEDDICMAAAGVTSEVSKNLKSRDVFGLGQHRVNGKYMTLMNCWRICGMMTFN